jgi:uncharacterized protein with von Willebrand factor type A (vWA) domain
MATYNDVTGHALVSKVGDKDQQEKFNANFDAIFGVKPKKEKYVPPALSDPLCKVCGKHLAGTKECAWTGCQLNWDESRIDVIGQNGNVGYETQD